MQLQAREQFVIAPSRPLDLSIIIPTLNEAGNVLRIFERLVMALPDIEWEAIFVDDGSTDGTPETITRLAQTDRRARLIRRFGRRGLSSAVLEGMLSSTAPVTAVIDADLQHDESILPDLYAAVASGDHQLAVGTRYAGGGSIGQWSESRARISRIATQIAGLVIKTPLSDPMSGFFVIDRNALLAAAPNVTGIGYKILLDIVASSPERLTVAERPYEFRTRTDGESKLDSLVALEYFELLMEKLVGKYIPPKFILFTCVGALGLVIHLFMLGLTLNILSIPFHISQAIAVVSAMTFNFVLNNSFTYRDRRLKGPRFLTGLASFYLVCGVGAVANVGVGEMLYDNKESWWLAGIAGALIGSVWNYAVGSILTWRKRK